MQTITSGSWTRMIFAFGAVLLTGGSSLCFAAGPGSRYYPISSVILGPNKVAINSVTQYIFAVAFNDGETITFPLMVGATFTSVPAGAVSVLIFPTFTAPATPQRAKITATYHYSGLYGSLTTSASKIIFVQDKP